MSKFLLISHIFPPAIDGGSKVINKLGHFFEQQNHQTLYLSSNCSTTDDFIKSNPKISPKILPNQIKLPVYHQLRLPLKIINLFLPPKLYFYGLLKIFQKGPVFKLIPFLKATLKITKFNPDFIIAGPLPTTTILYAKFFHKITKAKLLINASFHQTDQDFFATPLIKTLQKTDYLWTLTQYETDYFIKKIHINPNKIIFAGNGVDPRFIIKKPKKTTNNIMFIGNLSAHKRVDFLIKTFFNLIFQNPKYKSVRLTIVGQKTLFYPKINKIYQSFPSNIKKQIKFKFNVITTKQLTKEIDQCQFLVLPSIQESFGLVLIESWARGKPVITTNIPPLQELVTKSNGGLTFKIDNQDNLQKQLTKLLDHPKLCQQLGKNGLNYVKNNYTWPIVGQKIWKKISS